MAAEDITDQPSAAAPSAETGSNEPDQLSPEHPSGPPVPYEDSAGLEDAFAAQLDMTYQPRVSPYDLTGMAAALPQQPYRGPAPAPYGSQRYDGSAMYTPVTTGHSPTVPFPAPSSMATMSAAPYYLPHASHMAPLYQPPLSPQPHSTMTPRTDGGGYYASPSMMMNHSPHAVASYYYRYPGSGAYPTQNTFSAGSYGMPPQYHQPVHDTRLPQPTQLGQEALLSYPTQDLNENSSNGIGDALHSNRPGIVRGPPRKPRQSGHAVWIGNLPPQTNLMDLVEHVCKEAGTDGLDSVFLISKSNCAFINFKDERHCAAGQRKLHDSKFGAVRLVSRLRKSMVEGPTGVAAPTGPTASSSHAAAPQEEATASRDGARTNGEAVSAPAAGTTQTNSANPSVAADGVSGSRDRFFILKSLTTADLELSVRNGVWATQAHNEEMLNSAYKNSDNVYLFFSANKSGGYFGYARMASEIIDDPALAIEFAPSTQPTSASTTATTATGAPVKLPTVIPTEPTEFAPRGRIVDDSDRGTIFWEAERNDENGNSGNTAAEDDEGDAGSVRSGNSNSNTNGNANELRTWGKPFRLEWLCTARIPFFRARGLRNPWNSNREVKIARDGTELEPSVGRRLIACFDRLPVVAGAAVVGIPPVPPPAPGLVQQQQQNGGVANGQVVQMAPMGVGVGVAAAMPTLPGYPPMHQ